MGSAAQTDVWHRTRSYFIVPVVAEARDLLHRRKVTYAALGILLLILFLFSVTSELPLTTEQGRPAARSHQGVQLMTSIPDNNRSDVSNSQSPSNSIDVHSSQTSSGGGSSSQSVTVNGQPIAIPEQGSTHVEVPNTGGTTSVDISHESWGEQGMSSSLQVNVQSESGGNGG